MAGHLALVVDHEPETSTVVARALRAAEFEVVVEPDSGRAAERCDAAQPSVVLVGASVPDVATRRLVDRLHAHVGDRMPRIIVVVTRDTVDPDGGHPSLDVDDCVTSPIDVPDLVARVCAQVDDGSASVGAVPGGGTTFDAVSLLRRIDPGVSMEATARVVCEELSGRAGIEAAGVVAFRGGRSAVSVAGTGVWESWRVPGEPLAPGIARVLHDAVADGPRINRASNRRARDLHVVGMREATGSSDVALAPIMGDSEPLGVLAIAAAPSDELAWGNSILSTAIDVAAVLRALLAPDLERAAQLDQTRSALLQMIHDGAFTPMYQPVVDLASGRVVGFEALTRWHDGVAPDVRFNEAHTVGLGVEVECAAIRRLLADAPDFGPDVWLSFNVSPAVVQSGALEETLAGEGRDLVIELTEHDEIQDYDALRSSLPSRAGVVVAVDDAGGGYASMRHVLDLRPGIVKLDINWVHDIDSDPARQALTSAMVGFAHEMGIHVIAEGIETLDEQRTLLGLGLTTGQGYLFADALPADALPSGPFAARA